MSKCPQCGKESAPERETGYNGADFCSPQCEEKTLEIEYTKRLHGALQNLVNFADIQRMCPDVAGKALFWAAINEAKKILKEREIA